MSSNDLPTPLVSTAWLAKNLGASDLVVLDGSWYLPGQRRNPKAEYRASHILGALFFDIDALSDQATPLPHMLASAENFAVLVSALGVGSGDRIVVYDGMGLFSAARVWWIFRAMGHDAVSVLDGGLHKWQAEGHPVEAGVATRAPQKFHARFRPALVRALPQISENLPGKRETIVDARPAGRFAGTEPEPRPGLRGGHIPDSRNVPSSKVITPEGRLRPPAELDAIFADAGVDLAKPIVTSCGSGVSAAILSLALDTMGVKDVPVYDGSWAEWGARDDVPVETS